jgi:hypothetical protein
MCLKHNQQSNPHAVSGGRSIAAWQYRSVIGQTAPLLRLRKAKQDGPSGLGHAVDEYARIGTQDQSPVKRGPFVLLTYASVL